MGSVHMHGLVARLRLINIPWSNLDGVFNECKISDQESDDDIASINSKDNDDDADDDDDDADDDDD